MIGIPRVAAPVPAAHAGSGPAGNIREFTGRAGIAKQRISHGIRRVDFPHILRGGRKKLGLRRDPQSGRLPHVDDIQVVKIVFVIVHKRCTHAFSGIFDICFGAHLGKGSVPIVPVKLLSAEIVDHIKIEPAVAVVIVPKAVEAEAIVIRIHP